MFAWTLPALIIAGWSAALFVTLGGTAARCTQRRALAVAAVNLAPSAAAWALSLAWRVLPGLSDPVTVLWLGVSAAAIVAVGCWRTQPLRGSMLPTSPQPDRFWLALALLLAGVVYLMLRVPAYSNDPLEYAAVAKLLHAQRSLSVYPVLDSSLSGGLYAPWTHPPGFPLLMALMMTCTDIDAGTALKWVAALHVVLFFSSLAALLPKRMRWVAVLSMTATPAYMIGVINGSVEAVRLTALIGVFAASLALWQAPPVSSAVRLGALFGLCGFVHSLGILSAAFFLPVLILRRAGSFVSRIGWGAGILTTQLLMLSPDLWRNLKLFGVVLGDRPAVWQLPEVGRVEYFREFRGLTGPLDMLVHGLLQGFSQISNFGVAYWLPALAFAGLLLARRRLGDEVGRRADNIGSRHMVELAAGIVVTFYAMAAALTMMGSVEALKNVRYMLTVHPFVGILTAWVVLRMPHPDRLRKLVCIGLALGSLVPLIYVAERHPGLLTSTMDQEQAYFVYERPEADAVREVDRVSNPGHCAMLFQQADYALHGSGCFLSFLDHRFADVYRDPSAEGAAGRLRAMGIALIVTPSTAMPEIYNTSVGKLLGDPALARLTWSSGGFSIYTLGDPSDPHPTIQQPIEIVPVPGQNAGEMMLNWDVLAPRQPDSGQQPSAGLLCIDASGQGLLQLTTIATDGGPAPRGALLEYLRPDRPYVLGAYLRASQRLCVQQLAGQIQGGKLIVQAGAGLRVDRVTFGWVVRPTAVAKDS